MKKLLALAAIAIALQGCTTSLIEGQKQELETYKQKGLAVEERNPKLAAALGILPMAGYLYDGNYVLAFTTLPLYPFLGPLWMPFDTYNSAQARNYYATKPHVERERAKAMQFNDREMDDKHIDDVTYRRNRREIEDKFSAY
ncbi:hypothetical protein [Pseudomonas serbica]|jgi:hypothetical protein|uniref:hypothetical protein n=1 Tax=Pseudomonas serbica TaxID=2965074 RepID=UPI00237C1A42|nr:hypothetical protein [Pseudomonas serbica]